jgi:hypothetical protein
MGNERKPGVYSDRSSKIEKSGDTYRATVSEDRMDPRHEDSRGVFPTAVSGVGTGKTADEAEAAANADLDKK